MVRIVIKILKFCFLSKSIDVFKVLPNHTIQYLRLNYNVKRWYSIWTLKNKIATNQTSLKCFDFNSIFWKEASGVSTLDLYLLLLMIQKNFRRWISITEYCLLIHNLKDKNMFETLQNLILFCHNFKFMIHSNTNFERKIWSNN